MSAEAIAALNKLAEAYHDKIQQIDGKVNATMSVAPELARTYYVNQGAGDDTNTGTPGSPLASIRTAVERTPRHGGATIFLQDDYVWSERVNAVNLEVEIRSDDLSQRRDFTLSAIESGGSVFISGFTFIGANCWLHLYGLDIKFPTYTGGNVENPQYANIVGTHTAQTKSLQHVGLTDCDLEMPAANGIGAVCSRTAGSVVFNAQNITDVNANMAGRYIRGASGATPEQYASIVTNMTSL